MHFFLPLFSRICRLLSEEHKKRLLCHPKEGIFCVPHDTSQVHYNGFHKYHYVTFTSVIYNNGTGVFSTSVFLSSVTNSLTTVENIFLGASNYSRCWSWYDRLMNITMALWSGHIFLYMPGVFSH